MRGRAGVKPKHLIGAALAAVLASAALVNAVTQRYVLWTQEIGTQLVWRDTEALIFLGERNYGWRGGEVDWLFQIFKTALGGRISIVDSRTDLIVLRYMHHSISQRILKGVDISALQQLDGRLYAKVDDLMVRWNGAGFESAPADERERLFDGHLRYGDYDQAGGWSVRRSVLAWGKNGKCIPMTIDAQAIQLCQQADMLQRRKRLTLGSAGTTRVIWSLDSSGGDVSAQEYEAAVKP